MPPLNRKKAYALIAELPPDPRQQNLFGAPEGCEPDAAPIESPAMSKQEITTTVPACDHPDCKEIMKTNLARVQVKIAWVATIFTGPFSKEVEEEVVTVPVGDYHRHCLRKIVHSRISDLRSTPSEAE